LNELSQKVLDKPQEPLVVFILQGCSLPRAEDFGLPDGQNQVGSVVSDRFPLDKLALLKKKARWMHRDCGEFGARFLGGYLVQGSKAADLARRLDARVKEGRALAEDILRNIDSTAVPSKKEAVAKKLSFGYQAYAFAPPEGGAAAGVVPAANRPIGSD